MQKLEKSLEISEKIIELLNNECSEECLIHVMASVRFKLYYMKSEKLANQCIVNNTDVDIFFKILKDNYEHQSKSFENMLARFREIDDFITMNYLLYKKEKH